MFGLLKKYDVHMCSEVKGRILLDGNPVYGTQILRDLSYVDDVVVTDETETDRDGYFSMPAVTITSKKPGDMFVHDVVMQHINVLYDGVTYKLWNTRLLGIEPFAEVEAKLKSLNGDLANSEVQFTFPNKQNPNLEFDGESICRWDNDFEIFEIVDDGTQFFSS
ncbi:DUF6795 domain-containing protein [Shewanella sp. S1-58-MNA-CIBAN-0166]|jgi:hypothetical protein|uniref:DUF6795 domain-containing protein n=1 Tax=Shewanella sp. S1-58-MNA-CIBAN-0166 TaxID=3140467 RepID=UPI003320C307